MSPTTRSATSKKGGGKKTTKPQPKATSIKKTGAKKAGKVSFAKRNVMVEESLPVAEEMHNQALPTAEKIRAAIGPGGTSVGDLMIHFKVRPQDREDMNRLLESIGNITSAVPTRSEEPANKSPTLFEDSANRTTQGFRPVFDRLRKPSVADLAFGRPNTPRYSPVSLGRSLSAGGLFASSPRRSDYGKMSSVSSGLPAAGEYNAASPRESDLRRMVSLDSISSRRVSLAPGVVGSSPRRSTFWRT